MTMKTQESIKLNDLVLDRIQRSIEVKQALLSDATFRELVAQAAMQIVKSLRAGGKVLFFGNGGSAADAQHLAAEFTGRYLKERRALPALALHGNSSAVTAIGNDYGFEFVFARQMEALGQAGDVAVGISTSGNSPNVLRALEVATVKRNLHGDAHWGVRRSDEKPGRLRALHSFGGNSADSRMPYPGGPHHLRDRRRNAICGAGVGVFQD